MMEIKNQLHVELYLGKYYEKIFLLNTWNLIYNIVQKCIYQK